MTECHHLWGHPIKGKRKAKLKIAIGLVVVALFVGSMTAHAANYSEGYRAFQRGDCATALPIFRQLADQGNARAQYNLGVMYANELGVPQDYGEAVNWYRKSADQGYVWAARHPPGKNEMPRCGLNL